MCGINEMHKNERKAPPNFKRFLEHHSCRKIGGDSRATRGHAFNGVISSRRRNKKYFLSHLPLSVASWLLWTLGKSLDVNVPLNDVNLTSRVAMIRGWIGNS